MNVFLIRKIQQNELIFLEEMLFEAIFIPKGEQKLPKEVIYQPKLYKYIQDFDIEKEVCFVAVVGDELVGAIWARIFAENSKGYGFVNSETPELSMAIYEAYRNRGLGTQLLKAILNDAVFLNYNTISLSVDKRNFAHSFYKKHGFVPIKTQGNSVTMIKYL